jgi:hypothetical protein
MASAGKRPALALRIVRREVRLALGARHVAHHLGPLFEEAENVIVEVVDSLPEVVEGHLARGL